VSLVRVTLPPHLQTLAGLGAEVSVEVADVPSITAVLDVLETDYPVLLGTIRDRETGARRAYMRFHACGTDLSHEPTDEALPNLIADGHEPLRIVGAIAGG
jgi:sulfur-carrier protein